VVHDAVHDAVQGAVQDAVQDAMTRSAPPWHAGSGAISPAASAAGSSAVAVAQPQVWPKRRKIEVDVAHLQVLDNSIQRMMTLSKATEKFASSMTLQLRAEMDNCQNVRDTLAGLLEEVGE